MKIVRSMLHAHATSCGADPSEPPTEESYRYYEDFDRALAFYDVVKAIEKIDKVPCLEWSILDRGPTWVQWSAESNGFFAKIVQMMGTQGDIIEVHSPTGFSHQSTRLLYRTDCFMRSLDDAKRAAETVIHRHRQMLDEIEIQ